MFLIKSFRSYLTEYYGLIYKLQYMHDICKTTVTQLLFQSNLNPRSCASVSLIGHKGKQDGGRVLETTTYVFVGDWDFQLLLKTFISNFQFLLSERFGGMYELSNAFANSPNLIQVSCITSNQSKGKRMHMVT